MDARINNIYKARDVFLLRDSALACQFQNLTFPFWEMSSFIRKLALFVYFQLTEVTLAVDLQFAATVGKWEIASLGRLQVMANALPFWSIIKSVKGHYKEYSFEKLFVYIKIQNLHNWVIVPDINS
jgi:hypothetical protein